MDLYLFQYVIFLKNGDPTLDTSEDRLLRPFVGTEARDQAKGVSTEMCQED